MRSLRQLLIGYDKKTDEEITQIWTNCLVAFDANVLLNLYRYSSGTRKEILRIVRELKDKIFLTYQAALEFSRNRFDVIAEQSRSYAEFTTQVNNVKSSLESIRHPFISDKLHEEFMAILIKVMDDLRSSEVNYKNLLNKDEVYAELDNIFTQKITEKTTKDELQKISIEGRSRYERKIPPGYADDKNKDESKKYGDLIIWRQIIVKAKAEKKHIIFVTDDEKEDWMWTLKNGMKIGPRAELCEEMWEEAGVYFHVYSTQRFIEFTPSILKTQTKPETIREVSQFFIDDIKYRLIDDNIFKYFAGKQSAVLDPFTGGGATLQGLNILYGAAFNELRELSKKNDLTIDERERKKELLKTIQMIPKVFFKDVDQKNPQDDE